MTSPLSWFFSKHENDCYLNKDVNDCSFTIDLQVQRACGLKDCKHNVFMLTHCFCLMYILHVLPI